MAAVVFLRCAGGAGCIVWLHDCFWPAGPWRRDATVWQMLWNYQPMLLGLRFVVSFLILLVPATAMGLTLPVIIENPLLRETDFGRAIGFLYGSNTLGAMLGAVPGEAYLIGAFGLYGTSVTAGATLLHCCRDCGFGGEIWSGAIRRFQKHRPGGTLQIFVEFRRELSASVGFAFRQLRDGPNFLALEVICFRFLRLYVASSPTAFGIIQKLKKEVGFHPPSSNE
jgi:spermidine synthase